LSQHSTLHLAVDASHLTPIWTAQQRPHSATERGAHLHTVDTTLREAVVAAKCQTVCATLHAAYYNANVPA
jgi:hypothetical protein